MHSSSRNGSSVNLSAIREMINESQRQGTYSIQLRLIIIGNLSCYTGAHTPQGRVTAVSQQLPNISTPLFFQNFFDRNGPISSSSSLQPGQTQIGYTQAHAKYQDERQRWSSSAYKIPPAPRSLPGQISSRAQIRDEVRILLQVSYLLLSGKVDNTVSFSYII